MAKVKLLINPENWVHDQIEIIVDEAAGRLTVFDYDFDLVQLETIKDDPMVLESFSVFAIRANGERGEYPTCTVSRMVWKGKADPWEAMRSGFAENEYSRQGETPFIAAARFIANTH